MPATPVSRRKSGRALPELPPGLLNATLLVPRAVFPKERVPAGFKGWGAQVVGADTKHYDDGVHCTVKFLDYDELYHFPISVVQRWVVEAGEGGGGSRTPAGRRSAAARARARLEAAAMEEEDDEEEEEEEEAQQQQKRSAARAAASSKAGTPRRGSAVATPAAATPYSLRRRQRETAAEDEQQQQEQQPRLRSAQQQSQQQEQDAARGELETDGEEPEDLTFAGKVAAALREGLFTALAVLIVYALLSRFYQPLDAIA